MSHAAITTRLIESLKPGLKPYFVRDTKCKGFGVKVNPSGSVKYFAEAKHQGRTNRKTLGEYPLLPLDESKQEAMRYLGDLKSGRVPNRKQQKHFKGLFDKYITSGRLVGSGKKYKKCCLSD